MTLHILRKTPEQLIPRPYNIAEDVNELIDLFGFIEGDGDIINMNNIDTDFPVAITHEPNLTTCRQDRIEYFVFNKD